jgi:UDP-N-acetylglucosamine 2-epimerase
MSLNAQKRLRRVLFALWQIVSHIRQLLDDPAEYARMARATNPYGDGHAAERIVNAIMLWQK